MADYKYSYQNYDTTSMVRAVGKDLPISPKHAIEICNYLRKRKVSRAITILEQAIAKTNPIPFRRFIQGIGHKKGQLSSGKFPVKSSTEMLSILRSAVANAKFKGLTEEALVIESIQAQRGATPMRFGRIRGRSAKRTHVEIVLREQKKDEKPPKKKNTHRSTKYKRNTRRD